MDAFTLTIKLKSHSFTGSSLNQKPGGGGVREGDDPMWEWKEQTLLEFALSSGNKFS